MICRNCKRHVTRDSVFCRYCGSEVTPPSAIDLDENNLFLDRLYAFGSSQKMFFGVVLFLSMQAILLIANIFTEGILAIMQLPFLVAAFAIFLIYKACKEREMPGTLLTAFKIIKVFSVLLIIFLSLIIGAGFIAFVASFWEEGVEGYAILVGGISIAIVGWIFLQFYALPLYRIVNCLRDGIYFGASRKIRGSISFIVVTCIIFALAVIGTIGVGVGDGTGDTPINGLTMFLSILSSAGMLFIASAIWDFARSIARDPIVPNVETEVGDKEVEA